MRKLGRATPRQGWGGTRDSGEGDEIPLRDGAGGDQERRKSGREAALQAEARRDGRDPRAALALSTALYHHENPGGSALCYSITTERRLRLREVTQVTYL